MLANNQICSQNVILQALCKHEGCFPFRSLQKLQAFYQAHAENFASTLAGARKIAFKSSSQIITLLAPFLLAKILEPLFCSQCARKIDPFSGLFASTFVLAN